MISLKTVHRSAATKASHYYADQKDDYYSRDGTAAQWQGKAAAEIGLTGAIEQGEFLRALRGDFGPDVKLSRSVRLDSEARAALDMTFSPPKSVSIQALVGKDGRVISAHDQAVTTALEFLEREVLRARQTERGVTLTERSGNAVIAKFRHETARPTEGAYSDPQLHTHSLLMNVTQRADGTWVAISNDEIFRLKSLVESVYHAELANGLEKAGLPLRYTGKSFELAHISREQIEAFSKRTQDINAELAALGETRQTASHALKQTIAIKTRFGKAPEISREELQKDWATQAADLGIDFTAVKRPIEKENEPQTARPGKLTPEAAALVADASIRWAIKHHTERESVMDGMEMLKTALRRAHGTGVDLKDLKAAVKRSLDVGHLILGKLEYRHARDHNGAGMSRSDWVESLIKGGMGRKHAE